MKTTRLFAADLGASGGKCFAGILSESGFKLQEVHRFAHDAVPFHLEDRHGTVTERLHWDDAFLYHEILRGLRAYRRDIGPELDAVGIDTWGADGQLLSADGETVGRLYCYRDHRLDPMIDEVRARVEPSRLYSITGIHFQPFNLSNQLLWLVQHRAELLAVATRYLPVSALFAHLLGGRPAVDATWASVSQLMDAKRRVWCAELLAALGIPPRLMPEIVAPGTPLGPMRAPLANHLGLHAPQIVATAGHDTACAFAAAPIEDPRDALIISSGTWSLIGKLVPAPITTEAAMRANLSNEGGIGNVRLLKNCMGAWLLQELRRGWAASDGRVHTWDEITTMAAGAPAFGPLINPDDPGFYNPPNMEAAIVAFCRRTGQTPPATRAAFLRTLYESLALRYRQVRDEIDAVAGTPSRVVHIVGGGSHNALLNQFVADALDLPVLAGPEEATAVGNLMVQAVGIGALDGMPSAMPLIRAAFPIRRFEPHHTPKWQAAFERLGALGRG